MSAQHKVEDQQILGEAVINAGAALGLSQELVAKIIGRARSNIKRRGIDPNSKSGELSLMLIRCYRSLYALTGGNSDTMKHFMHTHNHMTQGVPAQQIMTISGLNDLVKFLDAMRGRA